MEISIFQCSLHSSFNSCSISLLWLSVHPFQDPFCLPLSQILNDLSPQGESLAVLARELGSKVYDRYIIQRKLRSGQLEKVQQIYESYIQLLAKDSQVGALGARSPIQESSGLCRAGEDKRGERGQPTALGTSRTR